MASLNPQKQPLDKQADLNGTELMPTGSGRKPVRPNAMKNVALPHKNAHLHAGDLTGVEAAVSPIHAEYQHFALPRQGAYPIDTPELLKEAQEYFDRYWTEFPLGSAQGLLPGGVPPGGDARREGRG
jgi:hypothetical protein